MVTSPLPFMMAITGYFDYNFTSTSPRSINGHLKSSVAEDENTALPCRQVTCSSLLPKAGSLFHDFASDCPGAYPRTLVHSAIHLYFAGLVNLSPAISQQSITCCSKKLHYLCISDQTYIVTQLTLWPLRFIHLVALLDATRLTRN